MKRKKRPAAKPAGKPKCPRPAPRGVYRARRPRESPLWRLLQDHLDEFLRVDDDRFASTHGPLRAVIPGAVKKFLKCGILDYGFARIRCPECGDEFLLAHSCKTAACARRARRSGRWSSAIQTYGNLLDFHPHAHLLVSWGVFRPDGTFVPVTDVPAKEPIEKLFRHKILRMLKDEEAIDDAVVESMLAWHHLGLLAPEESRAPPATAPSPASPPTQAAPHDIFSSTALSFPVPFSEIPAWDLPEPPGPDHAGYDWKLWMTC